MKGQPHVIQEEGADQDHSERENEVENHTATMGLLEPSTDAHGAAWLTFQRAGPISNYHSRLYFYWCKTDGPGGPALHGPAAMGRAWTRVYADSSIFPPRRVGPGGRKPTMAYFVIFYEQGPSWVASTPMRDQPGWPDHRDYVNRGMYADFVVLGGPIGDGRTHRAMVIVVADDESAVRSWISEDPWIRSGTLRIDRVEPWTLLVSIDRLDPILTDLTKPKGLSQPTG